LSQASLNTHVVTEHMRGNKKAIHYHCGILMIVTLSLQLIEYTYFLTYCSGPVLM